MVQIKHAHTAHLIEFDRLMREEGSAMPATLVERRQAAAARFTDLGFPTSQLEEWRFTNISPIVEASFTLADQGASTLTANQISRFTFEALPCTQIVFVNGCYAPKLSSKGILPKGVLVEGLDAIVEHNPDLVDRYLAEVAPYQDQAFTALNTAFLKDGAIIHISDNVIVEQPIHVLFISTGPENATAQHPRMLVVAGANSQVRVIESYAGLREVPYFTNAVTEIVVEPNAVVDHYKILRESFQAFHIGSMHISLSRDCSFSSHSATLGGALVRNDIQAQLDGEGISCTLNGLYLANKRRLIDNHTTINHAKPNCVSHELYKGILDDEAKAVFNGKIIVKIDAQKTDAKQTNKALLLSEDAQINTKPQLEIFADDVKCTHGATIGQLDEDALFYLRSRGLSYKRARSVLIHAFASDVLRQIKPVPIRDQLDRILLDQLSLPGEDGASYEQLG